ERFVVEVAYAHDLDEVEQSGSLLPADLDDLPIHPPTVRAEELADALPLVVRAGFEVGTIRRAGDLREAVLPATGRTDQAVQGGTTPLSLSSMAVDARGSHRVPQRLRSRPRPFISAAFPERYGTRIRWFFRSMPRLAGVVRNSAMVWKRKSGSIRTTLPCEKSETYMLPAASKSTPVRLPNRALKRELAKRTFTAPSSVTPRILPAFQLTTTSAPVAGLTARPWGPARAGSFTRTVGLELRRVSTRKIASAPASAMKSVRSEEHTSELQSPDHLVCRLLLEKKKTKQNMTTITSSKPKQQRL